MIPNMSVICLTCKLATIVTLISFILATPLIWKLAPTNSKLNPIIGDLSVLPFSAQPLQNAFAAFSQRPLEVADTQHFHPAATFFRASVPLARLEFFTKAIISASLFTSLEKTR